MSDYLRELRIKRDRARILADRYLEKAGEEADSPILPVSTVSALSLLATAYIAQGADLDLRIERQVRYENVGENDAVGSMLNNPKDYREGNPFAVNSVDRPNGE